MLYFKPIRFTIFDNECMNCGLPVLEPAMPEVSTLGADQKDHGC